MTAGQSLKKELKKAFPLITFRVTSNTYSGSSSVDVDYTDGPTVAEVEAVTRKYEKGTFRSEDDSFILDNLNESIPQVFCVFVTHRHSEAAIMAAMETVKAYYPAYDFSDINKYYFSILHTGYELACAVLENRFPCKN